MGTGKDKNRDIDGKAVRLVEEVLSGDDWETVKFQPDISGIDGRIDLFRWVGNVRKTDLFENGRPTRTFYVQIKGRGEQSRREKPIALIGKGGFISQGMEVEHLEYYETLPTPVLLIIVDVVNKIAYWVFLQEYIKQHLTREDWRRPLQKYRAGKLRQMPEISIRVPAANRLDDTARLKDAVKRACGFMAAQGIERGMEYESDVLRSLDPRFDVELSISKGRRHFAIESRVPASITLSGTIKKQKLDDLIGRGLPISIVPGELKLEGSPLWQTIMERVAENGGKLQFIRQFDGFVNFIHLESDDEEIARFDCVPCKFEGGEQELRYTSRTPFNLLTIEGELKFGIEENPKFSITRDIHAWYQRPLMSLPLFEQMEKFLTATTDRDLFRFEFSAFGGLFCTATVTGASEFTLSDTGRVIETLAKARQIASRYGINPITPDGFTRKCLRDIDRLYELINGREIERSQWIKTLRVFIPVEIVAKLLDSLSAGDSRGTFAGSVTEELPFLGETVKVDSVLNTVTQMKLITKPSTIRARLRTAKENVEVELAATPESIQTMRHLSNSEQSSTVGSLNSATLLVK